MKITFIGDPRSPGDRDTIEIFGLVLKLNEPQEVSADVANRLRGHSHFSVEAEDETGRLSGQSAGEAGSSGSGGDGGSGRPEESPGKTGGSARRGRSQKPKSVDDAQSAS
ncbi:hypothetical protein [Alcaligenes faecalis]|uniref:hypothetical protein n=1 Tax=Alcaligenes faecalis TaxID=511 RepID=UPI00129302D1|nr:hypothetical protein [Alcaligenes faecalis]